MRNNGVVGILAALAVAACGGSSTPETTTPVEPAEAEPAATEPVATEPTGPAEPERPPVPDAPSAAPDNYKILVDNDAVRVLEMTAKPGDKLALHQHPDHLVYAVNAGSLLISPETGEPMKVDVTPGMAMFMAAGAHSAENTGTVEAKVVLVEIKKPGTAAPEGKDPLEAGPTIYKSVLDHEKGRVLEVTFKKKAKIPMHRHPDHAVYVLEGGKLDVTGADGAKQTFDLTPGMAVFLPAQAHSAVNVGKSQIKLAVFEIR